MIWRNREKLGVYYLCPACTHSGVSQLYLMQCSNGCGEKYACASGVISNNCYIFLNQNFLLIRMLFPWWVSNTVLNMALASSRFCPARA